jgi:protein-S-isoprenylcysteine O-methyltransferase Ste14
MLWLKITLMFVVVPGVADVLLPALILAALGRLRLPTFGFLQGIGCLLAALGLAVVIWVCQAFACRGNGTPAPFDPPRRFVMEGLYRWVRNPMYISAGIFIPIGEALFFETYWLALYALILWLGLHFYVTHFEEPALVRRFGRPYRKYLRTVPRWIPHLPKE